MSRVCEREIVEIGKLLVVVGLVVCLDVSDILCCQRVSGCSQTAKTLRNTDHVVIRHVGPIVVVCVCVCVCVCLV